MLTENDKGSVSELEGGAPQCVTAQRHLFEFATLKKAVAVQ